MNQVDMSDIIIKGEGTFSPPDADCGPECHYVLVFDPNEHWVIEHGEGCDGAHSH